MQGIDQRSTFILAHPQSHANINQGCGWKMLEYMSSIVVPTFYLNMTKRLIHLLINAVPTIERHGVLVEDRYHIHILQHVRPAVLLLGDISELQRFLDYSPVFARTHVAKVPGLALHTTHRI
jgi:hypothetical protein